MKEPLVPKQWLVCPKCRLPKARYRLAMTQRLQPGDELRCPHCGRWHQVFTPYKAGTDVTLQMLFLECRGDRYFAGSIGTTARFPTRGDVST